MVEEKFDLEKAIKNSEGEKVQQKLAKASVNYSVTTLQENPWSPSFVDKLEIDDITKDTFKKVVETCRFFYKRDPTASTVIDKMVDIGITDLSISKEGMSDNEYRIFLALIPKLKEYSEELALEFLISGLVVPEIKFDSVNKEILKKYGIKKYTSLIFPVALWIRDPATIKINKTILSNEPS